MPKFLFVCLALICFASYSFLGQVDYWHIKWTLLLVVFNFVLANEIRKNFSLPIALTFFWFIFDGIYTFSYYDNSYQTLEPEIQNLIKYKSAYGSFCILMLGVSCLYLKKYLRQLENIFVYLALLDSVYVFLQLLNGNAFLDRGGFFSNGSINDCFIASIYPLIIDRAMKIRGKRPLFLSVLVLPVLVIMTSKFSVPVGALMLSIAAYFYFNIKKTSYKIIIPIGVCILVLLLGRIVDKDLFYESGRFEYARYIVTDFFHNCNIWLGSGTSTFEFFGPLIQIENHYDEGRWMIWAHNDWVQMLFETGFVGLFLCSIMALTALKISIVRKKYYISAAIVSYAGSMVFNYPVHYPLHALFACVLLMAAHGGESVLSKT